MSMDPVKRLISIAGVSLLFILLYSIFSSFYTDVVVSQNFPLSEPNHQVLAAATIEKASISPHSVSGTLYVMSYQKGKVLFLENISMRTGSETAAYFSSINTYRDGPLVGSLLGSRGNVTLYVPTEIDIAKYDYVVFWSKASEKVFAYANLTNDSQ